MAQRDGSIGRTDFIDRYGLWTDAQHAAAKQVAAEVASRGIEVVRLAFVDQHGLMRGKTVVQGELAGVMRNGCAITTTLLAKDTAHRTIYPVFSAGGGFGMAEMEGAGDFIMVPDPATFRVLPWAPDTGWILCDMYFQNGAPVPFSTRRVLQRALADLAAAGYDYVSGLEVEFYVFKLLDPRLKPEDATQPPTPPEVELLARGFHYLTELRFDQLDPMIQLLRREVTALGLPVRTIESEFGASQFEFTFAPCDGIESADNMAIFRNAVKQICRRHGYHATFMCRPGLANCFASGWHLHQSLVDRKTGANAFMTARDDDDLSPVGLSFAAGILKHARASSVFSTPTINGYKRYRPNSLAPDRAVWGRDQKGAMLRLVTAGANDPATRLENRIGEPAANPYLYLGSQVISGLDGIESGLTPMHPSDAPYQAEAEPLPRSLMEACAALRDSAMYRKRLGDTLVDYILTLKESEIARFLSEVTDWEHREYFEMF
ncbi:MAG: glutamine synthetase family protein [Rhodospirillales bacterium]